MDIGKTLQDTRTAKNISLDTAAQETNIRKVYLEAVEKNEFALLPGAVFVKGIIRSYGNYLGLDGAGLVEEYKAASLGTASVNNNVIRESKNVKVRPTFKSTRDIGSGTGDNHRLLFMVAGLLVLLLAVGGGFYYYLTQKGNSVSDLLPFRFSSFSEDKKQSEKDTAVEKPAGKTESTAAVPENTGNNEKKSIENNTGSTDSVTNTVPVKGVTRLNVASVGRCWLRVTDRKGTVLFEGNLLKGESKTFTSDSEIIMRIGNLKDLQIEHNGKRLPFEETYEAVTRIYKPNEQ
ncbi:MAG TPA: hypothetical protein DEG55_05430 [Acidaminococcaceae bacterium]|nr:hypothetical protein [Acidaminococcaceae bacterium]